ncbi:hypothetical protein N8533_01315 [Akkermansiaceae bacterium]|nr:hypothetical protein [Akkermansiaceae bacterium]
MRLFLISLLSLFFLSGCGEKDPAQKFLGRYNLVGQTDKGVVISEDKTGFLFYPEAQREFTWLMNRGGGKYLKCKGPDGEDFTLLFEGSLLVQNRTLNHYGEKKTYSTRYERTK